MRKNNFLTLFVLFVMMMFVSCNGDNNNGENNADDNQMSENVYYRVLEDNKFIALDIVDDVFSNEQSAALKGIVVNSLERFSNKIESELGVQDIKLGLRKVAFSYNSTDADGEAVELSSVVLWRGYYLNDTVWYDIAPEDLVLLEHYTITSDAECPTHGFPMELLVTGNTLTIMPDYLGYGITRNLVHPYLVHDICARNSVDALPAGFRAFEDLSSSEMENDWSLFVIGASQGGGNALAVHKYMDTHSDFANEWNFEYSYAAAGPHSPSLTIKKYFENGKTALPVVFPLTLKAMFETYPETLANYTEEMMFSENYLQFKDTVDMMLSSKNYTTTEINAFLFENVRVSVDENLASDEIYLSDILSEAMFDNDSDVMKDLYKCLDKSDLTIGWTPQHIIKLFYSDGDRVVPYENSVAVYDAFGSEKVKVDATTEPSEHLVTCGLWMAKILVEGL